MGKAGEDGPSASLRLPVDFGVPQMGFVASGVVLALSAPGTRK